MNTPKMVSKAGKEQGAYEGLVIIPQVSKSEIEFDNIVTALKAGKQFLMREGYTRNSVYTLIKKLGEKGVKVAFGLTETGKYPKGTVNSKKVDISGAPILQFVLYPVKEVKEEKKA